jgi:hypothetical protein
LRDSCNPLGMIPGNGCAAYPLIRRRRHSHHHDGPSTHVSRL